VDSLGRKSPFWSISAMAWEGKIPRLPPASQEAADQSYLDAARKLVKGWAALRESG
jgi:hypothetical protein